MNALDQDEREILRFIERYQNKFGRTPSYEEIRSGTGMSSKDHVYRDVKTLEQAKDVAQRGAYEQAQSNRRLNLERQQQRVADLKLAAKVHIVGAWVLFGMFSFTRLVHALVAPVPYLWRPNQLVIWNRPRKAGA